MQSNILIVDNDREMLQLLKDGIESRIENLSVLIAEDGASVLQMLNEQLINMVVSEYRLPGMDGLSLLGEVKKKFPDIPVVITTRNNPEIEYLALATGAVAFIEKPFPFDDLISQIRVVLETQTEGGMLHDVSPAMFLQLVELEKQVCIIRLTATQTAKAGVLFFRNGALLDARCNELQAESAAFEIFSWDLVSLQIQKSCPLETKIIQKDMQAILLEAMRLKDENAFFQNESAFHSTSESQPRQVSQPGNRPVLDIEQLKRTIDGELGRNSGLEDIYHDGNMSNILKKISLLGDAFAAGQLKVAHLVGHEKKACFLLPDRDVTVVSVDAKCHRDQMIALLSTLT
jgi:CheY-like chemotaxis protein